jgi:hypothetical protein
MDGTTFDVLIKRLGRTRLTRLRAMQGVAAATAGALVGARLAPVDTEAAQRKRTICHCGDDNPQQLNCVTKRLKKKKAKRHLRRHQYDYKGKCRTNVGCSPANNTQGSCPAGQICSTKSICVTAGCLDPNTLQCPAGEICCAANTGKPGECKPNTNAC